MTHNEDSITNNPHLDFIVVLNPNSGPGERPWWPNEDYVREIPKLNHYHNVLTLGYVRTEYCKRDFVETCQDIRTYGSWSEDEETPGCYVQGIFFDETPNESSDHCVRFLEAATWEARHVNGIQGARLVSRIQHRQQQQLPQLTPPKPGHSQPRYPTGPLPPLLRTRHYSHVRRVARPLPLLRPRRAPQD